MFSEIVRKEAGGSSEFLQIASENSRYQLPIMVFENHG